MSKSAFPITHNHFDLEGVPLDRLTGMTLRQFYAAHALGGMQTDVGIETPEARAACAFADADALIAHEQNERANPAAEPSALTWRDVRNVLCILRSLDHLDLAEAGVLAAADTAGWVRFSNLPIHTILRWDDTKTDALWKLIQARMQR